MRVAFYAPLKAPDHPVPSGDRALARLFVAALTRAGETGGWSVEVASQFRSFDGAGDADRQERLRRIGTRIAGRLADAYRERPADRRPRLWFTYHLYHKAPDWLGPAVSEHLGIPYVVAEASHAPKQAQGAWRIGHEAAARAIRYAHAILALNRDDIPGVRALAGDPSRITLFPPFVGPRAVLTDEEGEERDPLEAAGSAESSPAREASSVLARASAPPSPPRPSGARGAVARRFEVPAGEPWLLCVAMMRGGRKLASFEMLANALARPALAAARWHLVVAGEGPARREVEAAFAGPLAAGRVTFTGRVDAEVLASLYAGADLFVWPAVGEPMGMAMLEAQEHGLPVVSARTRGVPDLVRHEETGLLVPECDAGAFADAVEALLRAPERRRRMGRAARDRVAREHGFAAASDRIGKLIEDLVGRYAARGEGNVMVRHAPAPESAPLQALGRAGGERPDTLA